MTYRCRDCSIYNVSGYDILAPGTATTAVLSAVLDSSSARQEFKGAGTEMQAALDRTDGCSKSEGDAEPQESAQQVSAHRGRGARSNGTLPVCLSNEGAWSGQSGSLCQHGERSRKSVLTRLELGLRHAVWPIESSGCSVRNEIAG